MWAIVPAAGIGQRIQPLACSKELLPVGCRVDGAQKRPMAVSEHLLHRLILGGATRICLVISSEKTDILQYFGAEIDGVPICYVVQDEARGLCDAIFRAASLVHGDDGVLFGLPDTLWFPDDGLAQLPDDVASLLLFPVRHASQFDAVVTNDDGDVLTVEVKVPRPRTHWIWGAGRLPARDFVALHRLWCAREPRDEYLGTLFNAYLARGGRIRGVRAGRVYLDVGTYDGYRAASQAVDADPYVRDMRSTNAASAAP